MAVNPFIWDRPLEDPARIVGRDAFAREVAATLKGQTNVALFGPRGTGKSSFVTKLGDELQRSDGDDAPPYELLVVDLDRAISLPAFIACVHAAQISHPARRLRDAAREQIARVEQQVGVNVGVFAATARRRPATPVGDYAELLHAQLTSLRRLAARLVVVFDEFQRLRRCPGEPLAVIRSALMGRGAGHVSLVFTGSLREALRLMLEQGDQPIFQQAAHLDLPPISRPDFFSDLELRFAASGRPIGEDALEHLLSLTGAHPKRTQQLAWAVWRAGRGGREIGVADVESALESLLESPIGEVGAVVQGLTASGDAADENLLRALFLLADNASAGVALTNRTLLDLYGFVDHSTLRRALGRLRERALALETPRGWEIVDPFLAAWLRRRSPVGVQRLPEG